MKTCIYVDAFNLYYGCLKGTPFRWLDIAALCRHELPGLQIAHIHVFAARVKSRPDDPTQSTRQQAYLRALETIPNLTIHFGRYVEHPVMMRLCDPPAGAPRFARVLKSEEKGSDVNLASRLLLDAFRNEFEIGVVISNDTDLKEPIRIVTQEFRKHVVVLAPMRVSTPANKRYIAKDLIDVATVAVPIEVASLQTSQFPATIKDAHGTITKPASW